MNDDPSFDERGSPVPAVEAPTGDEIDGRLGWTEPNEFREGLERYAPDATDARAQAVRAALAVILTGRTPQSIRLRAEILRHIAEGSSVETLAQLARRLGCSRRRLEQIRAEIFEVSHP